MDMREGGPQGGDSGGESNSEIPNSSGIGSGGTGGPPVPSCSNKKSVLSRSKQKLCYLNYLKDANPLKEFDKYWICEKCGHIFEKKDSLWCHLQDHLVKFNCTQCTEPGSQQLKSGAMRSHIRKCHPLIEKLSDGYARQTAMDSVIASKLSRKNFMTVEELRNSNPDIYDQIKSLTGETLGGKTAKVKRNDNDNAESSTEEEDQAARQDVGSGVNDSFNNAGQEECKNDSQSDAETEPEETIETALNLDQQETDPRIEEKSRSSSISSSAVSSVREEASTSQVAIHQETPKLKKKNGKGKNRKFIPHAKRLPRRWHPYRGNLHRPVVIIDEEVDLIELSSMSCDSPARDLEHKDTSPSTKYLN